LILRPYQEHGRDFLAAKRRALLADQMRVGKTPQAILGANKLGAERVLVVCPAIGGVHWQRELDKWAPGVYPTHVLDRRGVPSWRRLGLVTSYEQAQRHKDALSAARWDVLIIDECHYAKNPEAARTKLVYGKNGLGWHADYIWSLSGTPATKHAGELWAMFRAFGVVGMTYDEFTRRYCWFTDNNTIGGTREKMVPELRELLAKVMLRRTRKDVAPEMPEIDFQFLEVNPRVKVESLAEGIPTQLSGEELLNWLANNNETLAEYRRAVAVAKAPQLVEEVDFALESKQLDQTVVFGYHVEALELIARQLMERGWCVGLITGKTSAKDRAKTQDLFRIGLIDVVVGNVIAAGTTIDLSTARHGYFLELDWLPANNAQAASRLVSLDKKDPVTIDVCTWPGSTDSAVQSVLMRRTRELAKLY
jgi:SNF2 family DNA or RNA helicase